MALDRKRLVDLLASAPAFASLDAASLGMLAAEFDELRLAGGEVLMHQGDPADALYLVVAGELQVSVAERDRPPIVVDSLGVGAVIGEMALVAGDRRSATVSCLGPVTVARLARDAFDRLAATLPGLRERLAVALVSRLERVQLVSVLESWFAVGEGGPDAVRALQASVTWRGLPAGTDLYRPGDAAEGMYLVVSGRLVVAEDEFHYQVGKGESVGELGALGASERTGAATAIRDSHVVHVPAAVAEAHGPVMRRIAKTALTRLSGAGAGAARGTRPDTFALLGAHPGAPVRELAALLEADLAAFGATLPIDQGSVERAFGGTLPEPGSALDSALTHWLNEREAEQAYLLMIAPGDPDGPWAQRCRRQADATLLVADAARTPDEAAKAGPAGAQLVLLHPVGTSAPSGTAAWLERTGATTWHHVRGGDGRGVARLARRLTGRALAVAFSSGGARGYGHIGLLRAVEELGIEVDAVGGTSMGALIAAVYAATGDGREVERAAVMFGDKRRLMDRTLPLVALTRSQGVTDTFTTLFGDSRIEDLWTPFVCVSANLFEAEPVEHATGLVWEAVRASTAIPGVFTPLVKDGSLLVDGAVLNAFPVDLLRELVGTGPVIASSTMAKSPRREPYAFGPSVSGWRALAQYLKPKRWRERYPTMIRVLMEATSVGSKHQSLTARRLADVVVELPVQGFGKLEFHRHQELIELGYQHALGSLRAWLEEGREDVDA